MAKWITDNLALKLLALAAAIGVWAGVAVEASGEAPFEATLRFERMPQGLEVNPDQIGPITVMLRGPRRALRDLQQTGVFLDFNCSDVYGPGERTLNLGDLRISAPPGVTMTKATPSQIRLLFEEQARREVTVAPRFSGNYEAGYGIEDYSVEPATLTVVGPSDRVSLIGLVETDPIDLSGVVGTGSFLTTAYISDPYLRFVSPPKVTVSVRMRKR